MISKNLSEYKKVEFNSTNATRMSKKFIHYDNSETPLKRKKFTVSPILQLNFQEKRQKIYEDDEESNLSEKLDRKREVVLEKRRRLEEERKERMNQILKNRRQKDSALNSILRGPSKGGKAGKIPQKILMNLGKNYNPLGMRKKEDKKKLIENIVEEFTGEKEYLKRSSSMPNALPAFQKLGVVGLRGQKNFPRKELDTPDPNDPKLVKITALKKKFSKILKNELNNFVKEHSRCGKVCIHLKRFYERISSIYASIENSKGEAYKMNKVNIDRIVDVEKSFNWKKKEKKNYVNKIVEE